MYFLSKKYWRYIISLPDQVDFKPCETFVINHAKNGKRVCENMRVLYVSWDAVELNDILEESSAEILAGDVIVSYDQMDPDGKEV